MTADTPNPQVSPQEFTLRREKIGRRVEDVRNDSLAHLINAIPDAVVCLDRAWHITYANDEARRISRLSVEHLLQKSVWDALPRLVGTTIEHAFRSVMETGTGTQLEYFSRSLDLWLELHVLPIQDGIAAIYRDITDRKGAELLRDTATQQLRQVLDTTTDGVISLNRDLCFTYLNRRAREILTVKGDLTGKNVWEEFPFARDNGQYYVNIMRALHEGVSSEFEDFYPDPLNMLLSIQIRPSSEGMVIFLRDISARRKADLDLHRQQQILSTVQQSARVATWEADLASRTMLFGDGSYPVFGHAFEELTTFDEISRHVVPSYIPSVGKLVREAAATGKTMMTEFPVIAADGSTLWIESRVQAVFTDGVATGLRGLSIDITERKRNEDALAASEARYRTLADLNPQVIWTADPSGIITYANQVLLDYLGMAEENLHGQHLFDAIHPEDRERVNAAWTESIATGKDFDMEARMTRAWDGRARWWWIRGRAVRDEAGVMIQWLGVNTDIEDRKTFAEKLQQRQEETERQRAELETIYRTAPIGLALFDPVEFRYLRVNDRQVETLSLPREQILGRRITELAPLPGIEDIFRQVAAGNSVRNHIFEGELPTRPGEYRYWNTNYSPVRGSDGQIAAIAAVVQEITHQKKSEHALVQSEKLAAVGRLASSISHEINNPLEAVTNLLYLIANSGELPPSLSDYARTAQSELARVCQITTQTLRFHRQAVNPTYVTARDLVEAVLNLYQGRLLNSNIKVETGFFTNTQILCLENDIRQVLNNLIANAIDAMRPGGGRLILRAHSVSESFNDALPCKGIRITIADTGHGMSPEVRERIFEPFYTTKELNGTGLGLWISRGIVDRHHGHLSVRSTRHPVHHGTVFSLFLPCLDSVDKEQLSAPESEPFSL